MPTDYQPKDPLLTADESAQECGVSVPAFWKGVKAGRLPKPVYPASRAPRWRRSELHAALEVTRSMPRDAMEQRRQAKLAKLEVQR